MEQLQAELKAAKTKWAKEIELEKAQKEAPGYPFPVCCTRYVPRPESASAWDIEELPVRLVIHSSDAASLPVSVEVDENLPGMLPGEIEKKVEAEWKKKMKKKAKTEVWMIEQMLDWIEAQFGELLKLVPSYIDSYIGCDDMGASCRRYTLVAPAEENNEEDEEEDVDEEEQEKRIQEYLQREQERVEAEIEEKFKYDEERRKAALAGIHEDGPKARQLSKKELAEMNKSRKERSGHRWRKTGPKAHKPMKDEEDKSKKEPKKK